MAHQFVREPLRAEEADRLANACRSPEEKLIVWTLLDTGLRVSELCALTLDNVQWQQRSLRVTGKAGPHGSRRKQRIVPLSTRVRAILEPYFALVYSSRPVGLPYWSQCREECCFSLPEALTSSGRLLPPAWVRGFGRSCGLDR
jgi:integrase